MKMNYHAARAKILARIKKVRASGAAVSIRKGSVSVYLCGKYFVFTGKHSERIIGDASKLCELFNIPLEGAILNASTNWKPMKKLTQEGQDFILDETGDLLIVDHFDGQETRIPKERFKSLKGFLNEG